MSDETDNNDDYELRGPSLAIPPLYVLRTVARCPDCGLAQNVFMLGCAAYHDAEELRPVVQFHFLRLIRSVPDSVMTLLANCPRYSFDQGRGCDHPCLANHCRCGARLDDDYLHGDVGAAYWPDTPEGFRTLQPFLLPIEEAIPIMCSYTIGGGEYLDLEGAKAW